MLELTNMSKLDVRPLAVYVDVLECIEVDIEEIWRWLGMMRPIRKYGVTLEPRPGRYLSSPLDHAEDSYLVLPSGDLELFSIVHPGASRARNLFRVRVAVECSSGGETFVQEFDRTVQFGVFDPACHEGSAR